MTQQINFTLNGQETRIEIHPLASLLDALRYVAEMPGTKYGCGEGECGACTVILNDELVMSCIVPVCQVEGSDILTIEGLAGIDDAGKEVLHPIQQAFVETGGTQCGICTPGMVLAAYYYLSHPDRAPGGAPEALAGNLCRCTGYSGIFKAVERAKELMDAK